MAKHVYPPWHSIVQKLIFAIAVILCIALPVVYGEHDDDISSTTVIVVLVLYFSLWIAFSLGVRFGIASYTVESTLPIYTPSPAPPVLLHEPAGRDAVPFSPAIKISSPASALPSTPTLFSSVAGGETKQPNPRGIRQKKNGAKFADHSIAQDEGLDDQNGDESMYAGARHSQRAYPSSPVAPPSSPMTFGPPSPTLQASDQQGLTVSTTVHFQTRPRALTGESTHSSENYPTYATYRQQQHANFDAFAQRIRRALENANAQRRRELAEHQQRQQQQQEQQEQQEKEQEEIKVRHAIDWQDADAKSSALLAVPGTLSTSAISGQPSVKGRPRSSSAASMISNISEKLRLVSSGTGTFFGRSRAGSDASVTATDTATETTAKSSLPSSITTITTTTTTTTTTAAASALEHQGKSFESSSSASTATNPTSRNRAVNDSRRGGRLSGLLSLPHPLAESSHIDDHSEDSDPSQSQFQGNHDHDQENSNAMLESDQQLEAKQSLALTAPYDGSLDVEE